MMTSAVLEFYLHFCYLSHNFKETETFKNEVTKVLTLVANHKSPRAILHPILNSVATVCLVFVFVSLPFVI